MRLDDSYVQCGAFSQVHKYCHNFCHNFCNNFKVELRHWLDVRDVSVVFVPHYQRYLLNPHPCELLPTIRFTIIV